MTLRTVAILFLLSIFSSSCGNPTAETTSSIATSFVKALNTEDVEAMLALTSGSIFIREQEWESSPDGYGFVLGSVSDRQIENEVDLRETLENFADRVDVESEKSEPIGSLIDQLIMSELSGITSIWEPLDGYIFLRGMGDVEHIILIGVGPEKTVQAIYVN